MFRGTTCSPLADAELVAKYAASRSPADFALIVTRHAPMVLRTCQRLTMNSSDAEDAAQATFLALSQKPTAALGNLAGWLHKVARDCACQVLRQRSSRARREEAYARMRPAPPANGTDWREELDAALVTLPESLREAVVLRYLEGRGSEEAARLAGCNENTLRWRSMKGLERLRSILGRRGAVLTVAALATFLATEASAGAATVPSAALLSIGAAGAAGAAQTGKAALIAKQVLDAIFWAKVKVYSLTTAAVMTVAGAASVPLLLPEDPRPVVPTQPAPQLVNSVQLGFNASLGGRRAFPDDSPWNEDISRAPVDPTSNQLIASIGLDKPLFPAFGPPPAGIGYVVVPGDTPGVPMRFEFAKQSDPGPYPIPRDLPVADQLSREDHPLIVLDRDHWKLYEMYRARRDGPGWRAVCGAVFDLGSSQLRPAGWTSADAAGLPIFPGLVRYDEAVEQRAINHALRFTCRRLRAAYVAPARHQVGGRNDASLPPLGMRVRLRADFDVTSFPPTAQVILRALQKHGMFLAETGSDWFVTGTGDARWNDSELKTLTRIKGKDFEVVRMGELSYR